MVLTASLLALPLAAALPALADAQPAAPTAAQTPSVQPPRILVVGDSLSAEYGIRRGSGWVNLLQQRIQAAGWPHEIHNSSVSGDTSSAGASRLPAALLRHTPDIVILALGSNDALRGLPLDMTQANLGGMIQRSQESGARVLLAGMRMPPNYGRAYAEAFHALFQTLAHTHNTALLPFLLEGVATRPGLFQADRLHPTEDAQPLIADNVWPVLLTLLAAPQQQRQ